MTLSFVGWVSVGKACTAYQIGLPVSSNVILNGLRLSVPFFPDNRIRFSPFSIR